MFVKTNKDVKFSSLEGITIPTKLDKSNTEVLTLVYEIRGIIEGFFEEHKDI